jgi:hypothetical protein
MSITDPTLVTLQHRIIVAAGLLTAEVTYSSIFRFSSEDGDLLQLLPTCHRVSTCPIPILALSHS